MTTKQVEQQVKAVEDLTEVKFEEPSNVILVGYKPAGASAEVFPTKSARIRYLASTGMKTGDIAKLMGIRYQHVRNTLQRPLKSETSK